MKIYFTEDNKRQLARYVDEIVASNFWSEGKMTRAFEDECQEAFGLYSVAVTNGGSALSLLYEYVGVKGKEVIIPTNTFWATSITAKKAGAKVVYADCNKQDLCLSLTDVKKKVNDNTAAIVVVHIGGHISFEIEEIATFCRDNEIALIEDCAHAHGAEWNGKKPGSWGVGGAYSFYATKTLAMGEGGVVVTPNKELAEWARTQRNYGKKVVDGKIVYPSLTGVNYRISEFSAAVGRIQLTNLSTILEAKRELAAKYDRIFDRRVRLPSGMKSGYYKYIVFDYALKEQTGKVFATSDHCHNVEGQRLSLPSSEWVGEHHACPPIFPGWEHAEKTVDELSDILLA